MGKGAQKADLERLAKGLMVFIPSTDSPEYNKLMVRAVKQLNSELHSGKCVNDALFSVFTEASCQSRHHLQHALNAACVRSSHAGLQSRQVHGEMIAKTRIIKRF